MPEGLPRRGFLGAMGVAGLSGLAFGGAAAAEPGIPSTVYIGSFSTEGSPPGRGLQTGTVDVASGRLTVTGVVDRQPDASFLAYSRDRRILYATNELADGAVAALDISTPARPVPLGKQPTLGGKPTHLSV